MTAAIMTFIQCRMFLLLFSGLYTPSVCLSRQCHFVNINKNWTEAQTYCREHYTDLASIENTEEMSRMIDTLHGSYPSWGWIGLYDDITDWQLSLADGEDHDKGAPYCNWATGQPDNWNAREHCVTMTWNGEWNDLSCDSTGFFICYEESGGHGQRYFLISEKKTWAGAQSYCRENHTDLVSIRNYTQNQEVQQLIPTQQWVWIGIFREPWKWSDNKTFSLRLWRAEQPDNYGSKQHCVETSLKGHEKGRWADAQCQDRLPFFCYDQVKTRHVLRVGLTAEASLNVNDPNVMDSILQQMKERLRNGAIVGNFTLKWRRQSDGNVFHRVSGKQGGYGVLEQAHEQCQDC